MDIRIEECGGVFVLTDGTNGIQLDESDLPMISAASGMPRQIRSILKGKLSEAETKILSTMLSSGNWSNVADDVISLTARVSTSIQISKRYGDFTAIEDLLRLLSSGEDLVIADGEYIAPEPHPGPHVLISGIHTAKKFDFVKQADGSYLFVVR